MRRAALVGVGIALALGAALLLRHPAHAEERCSAPGISDAYDAFYRIAARRWYPVDLKEHWCIAKTICEIESRQKPDALSPVGAAGLCQIMPATAEGLERRGFWRGKLRDARSNVKAHALVMNSKWHFWVTPRPGLECRLEMTIASYNAGEGNIEKARAIARALCWEKTRAKLHLVTGRHAEETINYLSRFWATWRRLKGYGL